jgi:hypothetical protein
MSQAGDSYGTARQQEREGVDPFKECTQSMLVAVECGD